jgi:hypothetical protein
MEQRIRIVGAGAIGSRIGGESRSVKLPAFHAS